MPEDAAKPKTKNSREKNKRRFRMRYQDGVVEIGAGVILLILTLLNKSEYFFTQPSAMISLLVFLQPILSLLIFVGGVYAMRSLRHHLLIGRSGPNEIPLSSPMLSATLLMLFLLITAPLVWPMESYPEPVCAWALCGLGLLVSGILLGLGIKNGLRRFIILGSLCFVLTLLFTFVGNPGSLGNQLMILLGISGGFLISGAYALMRYLQITHPLASPKK